MYGCGTLHPVTNSYLSSMEAEEPIVSYGQLNPEGTYTYWDYLKWRFTERVELIRGKLFKMSPAPSSSHQRVSLNLTKGFISFVDGHTCQLFVAPFDVRLPVPKAGKDSTVVQPDLCLICDPAKIDERGCNGAPDLVVEILSPGNAKHEMATKFSLYEESGVQEYWIVQPEEKTVLVYVLSKGQYIGLAPAAEGMTIPSRLFPALKIPVDRIFALP